MKKYLIIVHTTSSGFPCSYTYTCDKSELETILTVAKETKYVTSIEVKEMLEEKKETYKTLKKKLLDEAIKLNKEYFSTFGGCLFTIMRDAEEKAFGDDAGWCSDIMTGITIKRRDRKEPYETYYKVFEALGFNIEEE